MRATTAMMESPPKDLEKMRIDFKAKGKPESRSESLRKVKISQMAWLGAAGAKRPLPEVEPPQPILE